MKSLLILIAGIGLVAIAVILYSIHEQEDTQQQEMNLQKMLDPTPTYREKAEGEHIHQQQHEDFLLWGATNGVAEYQYEYGTNLLRGCQLRDVYNDWIKNGGQMDILNKEGISWINKAAKQGYQPAIDTLTNFPDAAYLLSLD